MQVTDGESLNNPVGCRVDLSVKHHHLGAKIRAAAKMSVPKLLRLAIVYIDSARFLRTRRREPSVALACLFTSQSQLWPLHCEQLMRCT